MRLAGSILVCVLMTVGSIAGAENVVTVVNGADPAHGERVLKLRESWRTGADDTDIVFGIVAQVADRGEGGLLALDYLQERMFAFGPQGEDLGSYDLGGEGPGQVRGPVDMVNFGAGRLGVVQLFPGRVELISVDGIYIGSMRPRDPESGGMVVTYLYDLLPHAEPNMLVVGERTVWSEAMLTRDNFVSIYDRTGREVRCIYSIKRENDWNDFRFDEQAAHSLTFGQVAASADGIIYVPTARNGYEITCFDNQGAATLVIRRDFIPAPRTRTEVEYLAASYAAEATGSLRQDIRVAKHDPDIESMRVSDEGELWVVTSRTYKDPDPTIFARIDVFARDGVFVRQNVIELADEHRSGRLFWLSDHRCVLITGLKDAVDDFQRQSKRVATSPRYMYEKPMELVVYEVVE